MHVLESYALQDNLKIDRPFIYEKYFPMATKGKYITLDVSSKEGANKYSYWKNVLEILIPHLNEIDTTIVQLGDKDDEQIPGCYIAVGQTDNNQKAYVIKNSELHICVNNLSLQLASNYDKKIVALFSNVYYDQFKPYWSDKSRVTVLEGERKKPSLRPDEAPKSIDSIRPEKIVEKILRNLGKTYVSEFNTLKIGCLYGKKRIESSLSNPIADIKKLGIDSLICRLDYNYALDNLKTQLGFCSCSVVTDKPIPIDFLKQNKERIAELVYYLDDDHSPEFVRECIKIGINVGLLSRKDEETVNSYKIDYMDIGQRIGVIPRIKKEDIKEIKGKKRLFYKSSKFTIHDGRAFPSRAAILHSHPPVGSFDHSFLPVIDHEDFWEEKDHFYFVEKK